MTNNGLISAYNAVREFFIFLRSEYENAANNGSLTSNDLVKAIEENKNHFLTTQKGIDEDLIDKDSDKVLEEIDIDREILNALPKNGIRANSRYALRLEELGAKYYIYKNRLYSEAQDRYDALNSIEYPGNVDVSAELKQIEDNIYLLNEYDTAYEKIGLDRDALILHYYYKKDLDIVNNAITDAINKFRKVGIPITIEDFNYNKYVTEYFTVFLSKMDSDDLENEEIKAKFEEIYWKCPELITFIELNILYIFTKNENKINKYLADQRGELYKSFSKDEAILRFKKYKTLAIENNASDAKKISDAFREGTLKTKDYMRDVISKSVNPITGLTEISDDNLDKVCGNLIKLKHSLQEYQHYLKFKPLIDEIENIYKEKDKHKNSYTQLKKEIAKNDSKILKLNFGIFSKNSLPKQTEIAIKTKQMYKQLSTDKVYSTIANKLTEDSSLFDVLYLASSFYEYLFTNVVNREKEVTDEGLVERIEDLQDFVKWPYITILNNIKITQEKDVKYIIKDRYNLLSLNLTKDDLDEANLPNLIDILTKVETFYYIHKNNINLDDLQDEIDLKTVLDNK